MFALTAVSILGGCSVMDRLKPGSSSGPKAPTAQASAAAAPGEIDPRRYIGPDYCPELRIYDGAQLMRTYQHGHQDDKDFVTWQASFGRLARECLYDQQGNVTIKVGVSGRVVAGPKGGSDPVTVPVKVVIVKNKEAILATDKFTSSVTIPGIGSTVFSEVRDILVPSPAKDRDYIIYVGFDVGNWDPMKTAAPPVVAAAEDDTYDEPAPAPPPPPPPPKKTAPNELPVPNSGFVLSQ